jgi:hypothetical protein
MSCTVGEGGGCGLQRVVESLELRTVTHVNIVGREREKGGGGVSWEVKMIAV